MKCPRCGSSDFETRRDSDGRNYTYESTCRNCDHFWWVPGGTTLGHALSIDGAEPEAIRWVDGLAPAPVLEGEYRGVAERLDLPVDYRASAAAPAMVSPDEAAAYAAARGARLPTRAELARAADTGVTVWAADAPFEHAKAAIRLARVDPAPPPADDERGARLLEAIVAEPDADGPRAVYADHLQQRGDPRGELIALQLARSAGGAPTARERALWSQHAPAWLGPVFAALYPSSIVVERGFLAAGRVVAGPLATASIGDPRWGTVVELACDDAQLITHPCLRSLRRLSAAPDVLARIARGKDPLPVEELVGPTRALHQRRIREGLELDTAYEAWTEIAKAGALSRVRALSLHTEYSPADHIVQRLFRTPLGKQLERIDIFTPVNRYALDAWLPELRRPGPLARVRCRLDDTRRSPDGAIVLERDPAGEIAVRIEGTLSQDALAILGRLADAGL
ncbi:MAG: TIGR02996 domain-containing protein [Deltaproteobacteria bacterium]|nr:TIGR02996 domain-containing protein [Deltaproteobacteria bacterium]